MRDCFSNCFGFTLQEKLRLFFFFLMGDEEEGIREKERRQIL